MDAVTKASAVDIATHPFLPSGHPIAMPEQSLRNTPSHPRMLESFPRTIVLRRCFIMVCTAALTAVAAYEMYLVLNISGLTVLQGAVLILFVALFAWVSFSFVSAVVGFVLMLTSVDRSLGINANDPSPDLSGRSALLLPTYNEDPRRVMSRLQAIYESVVDAGELAHFDFFVLSDTTDPDIWMHEEVQYLALLGRTQSRQIFYRHRRKNTARKSGNISEWVASFGGGYESMVILDADSLMTGDTIVRLAAALERNAQVGLIQTLPVIVNGTTLFARLQQFAGRLYGPMLARGIAWWHGSEGNYWGHNAAIRVRAFAAHAGLPSLAGRKPFGGHILSHDFVEAALMRRAGWAICMAPGISGSYEETPPSLTDHAARDRRWCQGNLQHLKVLSARGLHWVSRLHLLVGIGAYLTAPLWLVFLLLGIMISLQAHFVRPEYFTEGFALFPKWPTEDPIRAAWVFGGTMMLLIAPKLMAYVALLANRTERISFGSPLATAAGVLVEILISGLIAPVMMLIQTQAVLSVIHGKDAGWQVQRREDGSIAALQLIRTYGGYTLFGLTLAGGSYAVSVSLFYWMMPVILGLVLAIPLVALTSRSDVGSALLRWRLLAIPEEMASPQPLARANAIAGSLDDPAFEIGQCLAANKALSGAHVRLLPAAAPRRRGSIDADLAVANAKMDEADTLSEALAMLTQEEKFAVFADISAFQRLVAMPATVAAEKEPLPSAIQYAGQDALHRASNTNRSRSLV